MSKRDQWRKTVNEQLSINDKERQSVRRIMSRLRGNAAEESKSNTPAETIPVQNLDQSNIITSLESIVELDRSEIHTGAEIRPVELLDQSKNDTPLEIRPAENLDRSNPKTSLEIEPVKKLDQSKIIASQKAIPVKVSTVSDSRPVKNLDRLKEKRFGYLKLPNEILDDVLPRLSPTEAVVFLRLYRLSIGFGKNRCMVGMTSLTQACNISEQTCRTVLRRLIDMGHIRQIEILNTKEIKGTTYEILTGLEITPVENLDQSEDYTGQKARPNKDHDHEDLLKTDHHQSAHERETMTVYQTITGNKWGRADQVAYQKIATIPVNQIEKTIREVVARAPQKPGSLAYFVKEILNPTPTAPAAKNSHRTRLKAIVDRLAQVNVGRQYTLGELAEDVKLACAREGMQFDNDLFNELISNRSRSGD